LLIAGSMLGIAAALATFVLIITVRYRDGLEQRLRTDLTSGASALRAARTPEALKSVTGSLAAEGISVDLAGITAPGGTLRATPGGVLIVHELIPVGGRDVPATLTGSRAGIDRQVLSLEVTEAIGGVIALALLAALAREGLIYFFRIPPGDKIEPSSRDESLRLPPDEVDAALRADLAGASARSSFFGAACRVADPPIDWISISESFARNPVCRR
jgi:hypothetical protein